LINKNDESKTIDLNRFAEVGLEGKTLRNIITEEALVWSDSITFDKKGITILSTKK
jgi:hypothetical protein